MQCGEASYDYVNVSRDVDSPNEHSDWVKLVHSVFIPLIFRTDHFLKSSREKAGKSSANSTTSGETPEKVLETVVVKND